MNGADRPSCDVLILGAGPAGSATALALRAAGVGRVLLVDRPTVLPFRVGESATPDVPELLGRLGLHGVERQGHRPYHGNLSAWGGAEPALHHFMLHGRGHGWHLDRSAFDAWLRKEAVARGVKLASPASIERITPTRDGWGLSVRGLGEVSARVMVDAGGRRSPIALRLGAKRHRMDQLIAIAFHGGKVSRDMAGLSLVESCADGWWYATELPGGRSLVTLMTDQDIARDRGYRDPSAIAGAWRETVLLSQYIPLPEGALQPATFAAHTSHVGRAAGRRWLCVGDALMSLDPLTSSGISGALNDAFAAVPAILGQLADDVEPARAYAGRADATFKRYLSERAARYEMERRWRDRVFWSRRAGRASVAPR